MKIEIEARDFASPDPIDVVIVEKRHRRHGGFTYSDHAEFVIDQTAAEGRDLVGALETLWADGRWRTETEAAGNEAGIGAKREEVKTALLENPNRFVQVEGKRVERHSNARPWGTPKMLATLEASEQLVLPRAPEQDEQDEQDDVLRRQ